MTNDPADLIREVDALFVDMDHGYSCGTEQAKILVRRLRDALAVAVRFSEGSNSTASAARRRSFGTSAIEVRG